MYEMANLHFYLEKRTDKKGTPLTRECPVILSFSFSSTRLKTYTGRKIREMEWDKSKERVTNIYGKAEEFNAYLDLLSVRVETRFREILETGINPDPQNFKREMKKMVKSEIPSFFNLLLRFIEESSPKWNTSTYKKMRTFYSHLKDFSSQRNGIMNAGAVNQLLADELIEFYRRKGSKDTSIKNNLGLLRWFMNWCLAKNLIFNRDFEQIRFSPDKNLARHNEVFLKWDELTSLYSCGGLVKKEEWCRDIFCFIAFTGLRFSKLSKLRKESVNGRYLIPGDDQGRNILLNRFSAELCKKYENKYYRNNTMFPPISLITFHKHLHSAARKACLSRMLFASPSDQEPQPLYKLTSAQTAINTYFAHGVRLDVPDLKANSGQSTKSRIVAVSGALKLAEEKQILTTDKLYESIRNSG
jgi:integrase